jgi:hypothetical protein
MNMLVRSVSWMGTGPGVCGISALWPPTSIVRVPTMSVPPVISAGMTL